MSLLTLFMGVELNIAQNKYLNSICVGTSRSSPDNSKKVCKLFYRSLGWGVNGQLFEFSVSLNLTNWFRVFIERLRFGSEVENYF